MNKKLSTTLVAAAAAVMLTVAGCSQTDEKAPAETTTQTTDAASPSEDATETAPAETTEPAVADDSAAQEKALQELVDQENKQLEALDEELSDVYSDINVSYELPGTMIYAYTYKEQYDEVKELSDYFDGQIDSLQQILDTAVWPALDTFGHVGEKHAQYIYLNADGSTIWEKTFSEK